MTEAECHRLTLAHCRGHEAEWAAYLAKPLAERAAISDKVEATYQQHGVQAARDMMRALGMPLPPDELWDPVEELEAKRAAGDDAGDEAWMRETAAMLGLSDVEIEEMLTPEPGRRVDH